MFLGSLVEFGKTKQIFEKPKKELTERYISGKFG
jgi:phosphate transport system ATP-binding protein